MSRIFRRALLKGCGASFRYRDRLYTVIDDVCIYHPDSDTVYILDIDF